MGYRRPNKGAGLLAKRAFEYDADADVYHCPNQQILHDRTTNRLGYRAYVSNPAQCSHCSQRDQCTRSQNHIKVTTRHVWQEAKERIDAH